MPNKNKQVDYTQYCANNQLCLPMDLFITIPQDDPVLLLNAFVEGLDLTELYRAYSRFGRIEYSPKILLKIMLLGYIKGIYSSRAIHEACYENIKFRYLLEDQEPPSHNTISRFRKNVMSQYGDALLTQMVEGLEGLGLLSLEAVFIDGTKLEANSNKYQFRWRKATERNHQKLQKKMQAELPSLLKSVGIRYSPPKNIASKNLGFILKNLNRLKEEQNVAFVHGSGKRKTPLQKVMETVEQWHMRLQEYELDFATYNGRNSYSKTDPDATFMRMKEDHMLNGQLKPGYNINTAVASGFIIGNYISSDRTDVGTLIPFTKKLLNEYAIENVVADAGYESEENYQYYDLLPETELWVKPTNYEQQKKRKYQKDISRRENMEYDQAQDIYYCAASQPLVPTATKVEKTRNGFTSEKTIYECHNCAGCPLKEQCIRSRSNKPLEERNKRIYCCKSFDQHRTNMKEKIESEQGKLLRVNRSIQVEGVFAVIKQDMRFRRFMLRGMCNVAAEWTLLSIAYNLMKLHHKLQSGRLGSGLIIPSGFPAGL